jgi:hypothetical protein
MNFRNPQIHHYKGVLKFSHLYVESWVCILSDDNVMQKAALQSLRIPTS